MSKLSDFRQLLDVGFRTAAVVCSCGLCTERAPGFLPFTGTRMWIPANLISLIVVVAYGRVIPAIV